MSSEWEEKLFNRIFDDVVNTMIERYQNNLTLSKDDVLAQLEQLYILDGHDQYGRGRVADIDLEASIAAMQYILSEWGHF